MIYTKVSPIHTDCELAETVLGIPNILEYVKLNLADRKFRYFTEAIMDIGFFSDNLYIAPTLNNEDEHVLGVHYLLDDEVIYTGLYFYELIDDLSKDSILWICFEGVLIA